MPHRIPLLLENLTPPNGGVIDGLGRVSGKVTKPEALKEMGKNSQFLLKIRISILKEKPEQRFHGPPLSSRSITSWRGMQHSTVCCLGHFVRKVADLETSWLKQIMPIL